MARGIGWYFSVFPLFRRPLLGDVGDRWGRKRALVITLLGTVFGHLLTAVAIFFQSFVFLLAARAVSGFLSGNVSICLATISDVSPDPKTKGRNFGLLTVFFGMGWILAESRKFNGICWGIRRDGFFCKRKATCWCLTGCTG
ncbi:MAG: MFS transporter [Parachlamydiales bacterium]|nr:MFS transporter [Parachlamydiales bacterium]